MLLLLRALRSILNGDWACFGCGCWLASLALLASLSLTRDSSIPLGHEPSIPPGHETRLSREGTSSSIPLGHGHVYPAWARGSTTPLGHEPSIPAGHEPSIPPGHESSIPRGHELVCPTWARTRWRLRRSTHIGGIATDHGATARAARSTPRALSDFATNKGADTSRAN